MTGQTNWVYAGLGISIGAALGLCIGVLMWDGEWLALAIVFGSAAGLVAGAAADTIVRRGR